MKTDVIGTSWLVDVFYQILKTNANLINLLISVPSKPQK